MTGHKAGFEQSGQRLAFVALSELICVTLSVIVCNAVLPCRMRLPFTFFMSRLGWQHSWGCLSIYFITSTVGGSLFIALFTSILIAFNRWIGILGTILVLISQIYILKSFSDQMTLLNLLLFEAALTPIPICLASFSIWKFR